MPEYIIRINYKYYVGDDYSETVNKPTMGNGTFSAHSNNLPGVLLSDDIDKALKISGLFNAKSELINIMGKLKEVRSISVTEFKAREQETKEKISVEELSEYLFKLLNGGK